MRRERRRGGSVEGAEEDVDVVMCGCEEEEEEDVEMDDGEEEETKPVTVTVMMNERDQDAITQLEDVMRTVGYGGMDLEPIDEDATDLNFDFDFPQEQEQEILGDDEPIGQPSMYDPKTRTYIPRTRRVFDPSLLVRPTTTSSSSTSTPTPTPTSSSTTSTTSTRKPEIEIGKCSGGIRDVILTGETGRRHVGWNDNRERYRIFGRVRKWDGLVGFVRVDQGVWEAADAALAGAGPMPTGNEAQAGAQEEAGAGAGAQEAITNMIILGYVVGDGNFVGEWRMAASDPVRPGWCGPVFMCRRREEDDDELHGQGGGVRFEPVGGEAVWI